MTSRETPLAIEPFGDQALVATWEPRVDESVRMRVAACARRVTDARLPGVRDVVAGMCTVTVHLDPLWADTERVREVLAAAPAATERITDEREPLVIPVRYGGDAGPDLEDVARRTGCSVDEVIAAHTAVTYRVFMMGFLPGFPYLGVVDPKIHVPRLDTPRTQVPRGSVGLAGPQTGIYPADSPGGWRIIGRTEVTLFDPAQPEPFLLSPGQAVTFDPIA